MRSWRLWLEVLGGVLVVAALAGYLSAREDNIRMQATMSAQGTVIKSSDQRFQDAQKQISALQSDIQSIRTENAKQLAVLQTKFSAAQTPQQLADLATQVMDLKDAIKIVTPPATPQNPNPQPIAEVPLTNEAQAKAYLQACETCKTNLTGQTKIVTAQAELIRKKNDQISADSDKITALTKEKDAAVKAAKGGNWIHRAVHNAKVIVIGIGIGAAAICGSGHCK